MNITIYWIWLSLSVGVGNNSFSKLYEKYGNVEDIYSLDEEDYRRILGSRCSDITALKNKDLTRANKIYKFCTEKQVGILLYADDNFPKSLREIPNPPVLLYYRGILPDFNSECFISVVGTRYLSSYGRRNAYILSFDLARSGAHIVSGMAKGIDGVATAAAIKAGGTTVAVLGSGIDVCYPIEHRRLAQEIVKKGCVLTEYAPGTKPYKWNFPKRNRIISGLTCATVVIEGREDSGAIITARYAKAQGRGVYALPGNIDNKTSEVPNLLIRNGAKLITKAEDLIDDYEFVTLGKLNRFVLMEKVDMKMSETLRELKIFCVTPSDDIFRTYPKRKKENKPEHTATNASLPSTKEKTEAESQKQEEVKPIDFSSFDKKALEIYKRIPSDGDCSIESLVCEKYPFKEVLRILMKLEMGRFIVMLPQERVKRNMR